MTRSKKAVPLDMHRITNNMLTLPHELTDKILDYVSVGGIVRLLALNDPLIDACIFGHLHLGRIFTSTNASAYRYLFALWASVSTRMDWNGWQGALANVIPHNDQISLQRTGAPYLENEEKNEGPSGVVNAYIREVQAGEVTRLAKEALWNKVHRDFYKWGPLSKDVDPAMLSWSWLGHLNLNGGPPTVVQIACRLRVDVVYAIYSAAPYLGILKEHGGQRVPEIHKWREEMDSDVNIAGFWHNIRNAETRIQQRRNQQLGQ